MTKILIIEDDAIMSETTAEILRLAHYDVMTAPDGKRGVQMAMESKPDLIICDIMMAELDGYGVLHVLSRDPALAVVPFIFLSAKSEKVDLRKGMELGADDYLTKPFEEGDLLNAIETRLKKKDLLAKEYAQNLEGLNQFLDEARGMKDLETISQSRPLIRFKKKEVIFHEGDVPSCLYFLVSGKVVTHKSRDDGKEYITSVYKAGDFFGYNAILEQKNYSDSAVVLDDCEVCKIPKEDFLALVTKNRTVALKFIKMLSNNVNDREQQLLSLAYDTVRKRVAEALLFMGKHYQEAGRKKTRIPISRNALASMAGTATESVTRTLSDFKAEKLIETDGQKIVVLDTEGLKRIM